MTRKAEVFLRRYLDLVEHCDQHGTLAEEHQAELSTTISDLAGVWDCSPKAVRETLHQLAEWSLVFWKPESGRGHRSTLLLLVHPVHVYFARAERAEATERWAEAAFWYSEILTDCPCIPTVPERLRVVREKLRLVAPLSACCAQSG